jgi:hypothetical protein
MGMMVVLFVRFILFAMRSVVFFLDFVIVVVGGGSRIDDSLRNQWRGTGDSPTILTRIDRCSFIDSTPETDLDIGLVPSQIHPLV